MVSVAWSFLEESRLLIMILDGGSSNMFRKGSTLLQTPLDILENVGTNNIVLRRYLFPGRGCY